MRAEGSPYGIDERMSGIDTEGEALHPMQKNQAGHRFRGERM